MIKVNESSNEAVLLCSAGYQDSRKTFALYYVELTNRQYHSSCSIQRLLTIAK